MTLAKQFVLSTVAACAIALPAAAQDRALPFGFGPGLPAEAVAALPQTPGATGDQERHYYFKEAGAETPYHLFVPDSYDPATPTPLVVTLHGFNGNHDYFYAMDEDLQDQLEGHGFIMVSPMGYNTGSWFGAGGPDRIGDGAQSTAEIYPDGGELSVTELGEMDVMNVIRIVQGEYNIDPQRTYLMGHSMGGAGAWYLGQKYADMWAAIAPMSGTGIFATVDPATLVDVPVLAAVGGEEEGQLQVTRDTVAAINAAGGDATYLEIADAGHMPMIAPATPQILDFFAEKGARD